MSRRGFSAAIAIAVAMGQPAMASVPATGPTQPNNVGYPSVAAALKGAGDRPGAVTSVEDGWTIVDDARSRTVWAFAPRTNPAYPSVVKQRLMVRGAQILSETSAICEAAVTACNGLLASYAGLDVVIQKHLLRLVGGTP